MSKFVANTATTTNRLWAVLILVIVSEIGISGGANSADYFVNFVENFGSAADGFHHVDQTYQDHC